MRKFLIAVIALSMVCAFSLPAMAADEAPAWKFYGSARMATWYSNVTDGAASTYGTTQIFSTGDESDSGTIWDLQGNSRIGANVNGETIGGRFEYGSGPNLRLLYGTYNYGDSQFLVGQAYTPVSGMFYSNQSFADNGLLNNGNIYVGRVPMLQWSMKGLRVALIKPNVDDLGIDEDNVDVDSVVPKLEARYHFAGDNFFVDVFGGGNWYTIESDVKDRTVSSYVFGLGGGFDSGAFFAKAMIYGARNADQYGLWNIGNGSAGLGPRETNLNDNNGWGGMIALGFKASDTMKFEAGYGYTSFEMDDDTPTQFDKDNTQVIYVNGIIDIVPGFFIVPEFGYVDFMDDMAGQDEGSETYFGAKWQINF